MIKIKTFWQLLRLTAKEWVSHNPLLIGAAISFYVILSLGPILAVVILILSEIFGKHAAEGNIVKEIHNIVGEKPSEILQEVIQKASTSSYKTMAVISSIPLLFFGTTMVFVQLRNALNIVWGVKDNAKTFKEKLKNYSFSFIMLLIVGFFFFLMVIKSAGLALIKNYVNEVITFPFSLYWLANIIVNYGLITLLFAGVYQVLPKASIKGKDIWVGAAVTSLFFSIVQVFVGVNADNSGIDSALGAIGSFTILFLWIFYSSLVFLFGACFTKLYSNSHGSLSKKATKK